MAQKSESKKTVVIALFANLVIAIAKYAVALISGSAAMTSEAFHSTVDTGNELLLLLGRKRARKPPDPVHPFGHGLELYFWTLIVAILLFGVGGGMSIYEGISHLLHPPEMQPARWIYPVLGIAALSDGTSWSFAFRALRKVQRDRTLWRTIREMKDPQVVAVFFEDSAALIGLAFAAIGVFLSHLLHTELYDALAAILIGLTLATVALLLARETLGLLIGEAADLHTVQRIQDELSRDPAVVRVARPLSMHFGPEQVLINLDVQFKKQLSVEELSRAVDRLEARIRELEPRVRRIFIESRSLKQQPD